VKLSLAGAAALAVLGGAPLLLPAQPFDINQPQSPPRPTPAWLKTIDQGRNDPRLKGYLTPEGIKVEIVAEFPTVTNPVGMTFADDGTPYVLEWLRDSGSTFPEYPEPIHYKDGTSRNVATMKKKVKDQVKVLRDTKGKGVYDEAKVILKDELPSSILLHDGWLYLSGRGTVRRYRQSQPGGPYDVKEVIAQGFCGFHHHQVSGMTIGNDGWLYLTAGDDDNIVEGSDGSRATVLRTGAVFRCRPDGSHMRVYSMGYRNPYRDVAFDAAFNIFHADNDNEDGSKFMGCRLMHVAEGSDFGWRLFWGARCCQADTVRGAAFGELPGRMPPLLKTGRGSPAGLLIYNDSRFPPQYQGLLFYPDVFRKLIRAYRVVPDGSTFQVAEEFEFMKSDDPLFRPCQMVLGPDGAMYVCDWRTDSGGAGQLWGDGKHGRIYRVRWGGTPDLPLIPLRGMDSWAKIDRMSEEDLVKTHCSEEFSDRQHAQRALVRKGEKVRPALLKLLADEDRPTPARLTALGALESFWNDAVEVAFLRLLHDRDPDVRRLAADGLSLNCRPGDDKAHEALLQVLGDPEPAVRRAVFLAMGQIGGPGAADELVNALAFDDGRDLYLRDGLVRAIERRGKDGIERLVALAQSGDDRLLARVVEAFDGLRTRPAAEAIPHLLRDPHLSAEQRAGLVRSYGNYLLTPPVDLEPLADYLLANPGQPPAVKLAAVQVLSLGGTVRGEKGQTWLLAQFDDSDPALRLAVIHAVETARLVRAVPRLLVLLRDGARPITERLAVARSLRAFGGDRTVVAALKELLQANPSTAGEVAALQAEALQTLAVVDPAQGRELARGILEPKDPALMRGAVEVLGAQPAGAKHVGQLFLEKKLPRNLIDAVSGVLARHAPRDAELAKMLAEVKKSGLVLTTDKAEMDRVRELVRTKGDPKRGRALFLSGNTLACINCHKLEGVGGNVGPDLTRVWETQSVEKLIESLVEPSKEIKEGFQAYDVTTTRGQVYRGLKVSQTADEVVLRDANGKDVRVPAGEVEELTVSKVSLMPDNLFAQLSYDQFIDLIAFLKDRPAQESLRGTVMDYWVVGPFAGDLKAAGPPETKPDPAAVYPGANGAPLTWQARQAEPNGLLNLHALFGGDHAAAYALATVYAPSAQKVPLVIDADEPVRVWVDGVLVYDHPAGGPAPEGRVTVPLKVGRNTVLVKTVHAGGGHGVTLRLAGGQGLQVGRQPAKSATP
jgi:putative membrane-bound dehydrogenase-like protein